MPRGINETKRNSREQQVGQDTTKRASRHAPKLPNHRQIGLASI